MYFPLQLRLTLFYAVLLGLALWFFGNTVYTQAEQRAYTDLDTTLRSRAASVSLGKGLLTGQYKAALPNLLQSLDELGSGGGARGAPRPHLNFDRTPPHHSQNNFLKSGAQPP